MRRTLKPYVPPSRPESRMAKRQRARQAGLAGRATTLFPEDLEDMLVSLEHLGLRRYGEYLRTAHWARVQSHFIHMVPFPGCKVCDESRWELHHRSYKHMGSMRELSCIVPLCRKCHAAAHELILLRAPGVTLWNAHTKL